MVVVIWVMKIFFFLFNVILTLLAEQIVNENYRSGKRVPKGASV